VIAEAMASGLPVVSTGIAGIAEMVQNGITGRLVSPNDALALAEAMREFVSNVPRAHEFGNRGRQVAEKKFAIETSVKALRQIFERRSLI
jgi:glycosyltransferase involved in cell wall biosynthesis